MHVCVSKIHIGNREDDNSSIRVPRTEKIVKIIDDLGGIISLIYAHGLSKYRPGSVDLFSLSCHKVFGGAKVSCKHGES